MLQLRVEDWIGVGKAAPSLVWSIGITNRHEGRNMHLVEFKDAGRNLGQGFEDSESDLFLEGTIKVSFLP